MSSQLLYQQFTKSLTSLKLLESAQVCIFEYAASRLVFESHVLP